MPCPTCGKPCGQRNRNCPHRRWPHTRPHGTTAPTAQPPALATPQHSQVLLALEEALLALEEGALPEPALLTLATLLPAAVLQPIQEAVERFDFPLAQQRLQALRHQL